ncbi:MAG: heme-copper oxidase subunit III [Planctomycetes bacterium]|nr:heme-copper oxidase subunit III [Planctomycetota bacterium]
MSEKHRIIAPPPPVQGSNGDDGWNNDFPDSDIKKHNVARFAIMLLIFSEMMIFAGLISAYLILKFNNTTNWPSAGQPRYPQEATLINTIILLLSGVLMFLFRRSLNRNLQFSKLSGLLIACCVLGIVFLVLQGQEWLKLISYGLTITSSVYGSIFYSIIGFHAIHVLIAVVWLIWASRLVIASKFSGHLINLDICGIFWYFVVLLWPLLYGVIYF